MAVGRLALAGAVAAVTLAVFLPATGHEWLNYDDDVYVTENPALRLGLSREGVAWALTSFQGANWFPLTRLSWLLDYELHGLEAGGFLATNVALHTLNAVLLFLALSRLTGEAGRSAFVAAVFAVHPLHVESVAWVAARKDLLSGLFFVLALLAYADVDRRPRRLGWVFACLALGLLAKPILVTLPFVLLLLDAWPLGRVGDGPALRRAVLEKLPLFALAAAFSGVALMAQRSGGMLVPLELVPFGARLGNALLAYAGYLGGFFWPSDLAVLYPHPGASLSPVRVAAAGAALTLVTLGALTAARWRPAMTVGWLWFLGMLVPVIGLVQIGSQAMADRYTYLPLIGLAIAVAWGVPDALGERARRALPAAAAAVVAALAVGAHFQLRHWRDSASLFEHALRVTRENPIAHAHLGSALLAQGRPADAIAHYRAALELRPDLPRVANNLAWLLATGPDASLRDPPRAVALAERAVRLTASSDPALLDTLAAAYASQGRFEEAIRTGARAAERARAEGRDDLARAAEERLALFRAGRAYVQRRVTR